MSEKKYSSGGAIEEAALVKNSLEFFESLAFWLDRRL